VDTKKIANGNSSNTTGTVVNNNPKQKVNGNPVPKK
jgi:hypothetical protein